MILTLALVYVGGVLGSLFVNGWVGDDQPEHWARAVIWPIVGVFLVCALPCALALRAGEAAERWWRYRRQPSESHD